MELIILLLIVTAIIAWIRYDPNIDMVLDKGKIILYLWYNSHDFFGNKSRKYIKLF